MTLPREKYDSLTLEKLLFRRQFILGPHFVEKLTSWKRISIGNTICLTVHPDLNTYQAVYKNKSITLLGYILDPNEPQANDSDIINGLIRELCICDSLYDFFECTYGIGGRWILIVDNGEEIRLVNDATGLRQVFFTDVSLYKDIWCASQPEIIAETLDLELDRHILNEFMDSYEKHDGQYWWPSDISPYKEIKHLLPNHYLNLETALCYRYWPNRNLSELSLEKAVKKISKILQGLMESACNRFDLALTLTAGWDSRVLLAATKDIKDSLFYFTLMYWDLTENSPDVEIPFRLLSKLGLKHHVIKCPPHMEKEFKAIYKRNVTTAHEVYGNIAQGLYNYYPQNKVCIKGNASEVARCFYRLPESNGGETTAEHLAKLTHMGSNSFAVRAFDRWLREAREACYDINILDLFYWEQRMGSWQAMSQLEWDITQEVFTPFNCRTLLISMLSVDEKYRKHPDYKLYKELIINLWPEVLSEPINPRVKTKMRIGGRVKKKTMAVKKRIRSIVKKGLGISSC